MSRNLIPPSSSTVYEKAPLDDGFLQVITSSELLISLMSTVVYLYVAIFLLWFVFLCLAFLFLARAESKSQKIQPSDLIRQALNQVSPR